MTDNGNGKVKQTQNEIVIPALLQTNANVEGIAQQIRRDINSSKGQQDTSKYLVMEGMQNPQKVPFFTEYQNVDDVMRMNTIEMYAVMNIHITRKINPKFKDKLQLFYSDAYKGHIDSHKTNMASLNRGREMAYMKILSNDNGENAVSSGWQKFLGFGNKKK